MSEFQWFRMYHEFATDPKVQMLSEADQRRYVMLLCLRSCNGDVTLQDDVVTFQLRISPDEWSATKSRLIEKGLINDGNQPTAWDKRQRVSDNSSERVSRYRKRQKDAKNTPCNGTVTSGVTDVKRVCNVTVTAPDTDTDTDKTPYSPPAGGSVLAFADPFLENQIIERPDGSIELAPTRKQFWLEQFSGDEVRLALALKQSAGERQHGSRQPLLKQIERTLARIAGQRRDSDQRYRSAVASNGRSPDQSPIAKNDRAMRELEAIAGGYGR